MTRRLVSLVSFALVLLACAVAYAAPVASPLSPVKQAALMRLIELALGLVGIALSAVVTFYVRRLLATAAMKAGMKLGEAELAMVDAWLDKALRYAEEQARKAIKAKGAALTMGEKLEAGAGHALDLADQYGVPGWARVKVRALIEARLGETRDPLAAAPAPATEG